jgi:hypothetical protein
MSNVYTRFPNIEDVLRYLLLDKFPDELPDETRIGSDFPDSDNGYFVRIEKMGGVRTRLVDYPTVDIEVVAPTYGQVESLSESISMLLLGYPHTIATPSGVAVLDSVDETSSFAEYPYPDSSYRRLSATYDLSLRGN